MDRIFITVLNMSITASCVLAVVLVLRLVLRRMRAPGWAICLLWAVVFFRLLCPVAWSSDYSLLQFWPQQDRLPQSGAQMEYVAADIYVQQLPAQETQPIGEERVAVQPTQREAVRETAAEEGLHRTGLSVLALLPLLWLGGVLLSAAYSGWRWYDLRRQVATATQVEGQIYESDRVGSPFVMGLLKPKIYLPLGLTGQARDYIVLHEQCHIRRGDLWWKAMAQAALVLHWFNPLVYGAYGLLEQDLERACDEKVIARLGSDSKADYSRTLLAMSAKRSHLLTPLAFGESKTRQRVQHILQYAKPTAGLLLVCMLIGAMVAISCLSNPTQPSEQERVSSHPSRHQLLLEQAYWHDQQRNLWELYQLIFADNPLDLTEQSIAFMVDESQGRDWGHFIFAVQESVQSFDDRQAHCAAQYMETVSYLYQITEYGADVLSMTESAIASNGMGEEAQLLTRSERQAAQYGEAELGALLERLELSLPEEQVEQLWRLGQQAKLQKQQIDVIREQFPELDLPCDTMFLPAEPHELRVQLWQSETDQAVERNEEDYRKTALSLFAACPDLQDVKFQIWGRYVPVSEFSGSWRTNYSLQYHRAELEEQYGALRLDDAQPVEVQLQALLAQVQPTVVAGVSPQMELADRLRRVEFDPLTPSVPEINGTRGARHRLRFSLLPGQFPKEDGCYLQMDFVTVCQDQNTPQLIEGTSALWVYGKKAQWQQTAEPILQWQTAEAGMCSVRYEGDYGIVVARWDKQLQAALEALGGQPLAEHPSPWTVVYSGTLVFQQQFPQDALWPNASL